MKIWTMTVCWNQSDVLPFWLRHYADISDKIIVYDENSDDGSRELIRACPKAHLFNFPWNNGIDEDKNLTFAHATYPTAVGEADWVIWADCDEFIYHPNLREVLANANDYDVIRTSGFNMTGDGLPHDDGRQIWQILKTGVRAPIYSKPIVFRPSVKVRWNRGKHDCEKNGARISPEPMVKLLHYRYLGEQYTRWKNAKNYARVGMLDGDKNAAWTCAPNYDGIHKEHSPKWAEWAKSQAFDVIESPL